MSMRNYQTFRWYDQEINGQLLQSVEVKIFNPIKTVVANNYKKLIATDGTVFPKGKKYEEKQIKNYSYVILSTGFFTHFSSELPHLSLKLYITSDFDVSVLDKIEFLGKSYLIKAFNKHKIKNDTNYQEAYELLKRPAEQYDFEKVEQLFKEYQISEKHQLTFWKEMYEKTAKNKK